MINAPLDAANRIIPELRTLLNFITSSPDPHLDLVDLNGTEAERAAADEERLVFRRVALLTELVAKAAAYRGSHDAGHVTLAIARQGLHPGQPAGPGTRPPLSATPPAPARPSPPPDGGYSVAQSRHYLGDVAHLGEMALPSPRASAEQSTGGFCDHAMMALLKPTPARPPLDGNSQSDDRQSDVGVEKPTTAPMSIDGNISDATLATRHVDTDGFIKENLERYLDMTATERGGKAITWRMLLKSDYNSFKWRVRRMGKHTRSYKVLSSVLNSHADALSAVRGSSVAQSRHTQSSRHYLGLSSPRAAAEQSTGGSCDHAMKALLKPTTDRMSIDGNSVGDSQSDDSQSDVDDDTVEATWRALLKPFSWAARGDLRLAREKFLRSSGGVGSRRSDPVLVVSEGANIELTWSHVARLAPRQWLNDEVINFYFELLKERAARTAGRKMYFFNSFFAAMFQDGYNYKKMRVTKKRDYKIVELDKVFIPVHVPAARHWCLAVINFGKQRFEYYDSLGDGPGNVLDCLRRYVVDEAATYSGQKNYDLRGWVDWVPTDIPQQLGQNDCGIFTCKYADCLSDGLGLDFMATDMPTIRERILAQILCKNIMPRPRLHGN